MLESTSGSNHDLPSIEQRVTAHAVDCLYQNLPRIVLSLILMPSIILLAMWNRVDHGFLLVWFALALSVLFSRIYLVKRYQRQKPHIIQAGRWGMYFAYTSAASGIVWALASWYLFIPDSVAHQVLLLTCVFGLVSGSIIVTSYFLPSYYAFVYPTLGVTALRLAWEGGYAYAGLAVLCLMYLSIVNRVARNQKQFAFDAIRLQFENVDLVEALKLQKTAAEEANIAKSKFIAAASHDLRQPLHALGLFVGALKHYVENPRTVDLVGHIDKSVKALDSLFNALLDISKLDAEAITPDIKSFEFTTLANQLVTEYSLQAQEKGLAFNSNINKIAIRSDPALLQTILRNLLSNAIRYTQNGEVSLSVEVKENTACISVSDTGIGIPISDQQNIFREFFQLGNTERDRSKGLGLGLAIVRRLVDLLNLQLEVESTPSLGSTFRVSVPLGDAKQLSDFASEEREFQAAGNLKILIIDDENEVREAVNALLESWNYSVETAADISQALERIRQKSFIPDLIIADYRLREGHNGAEAIQIIKKEFGENIEGLIVTGDTDPERIRQVNLSGYPLLHKPVEPKKLRTFLRRLETEPNR